MSWKIHGICHFENSKKIHNLRKRSWNLAARYLGCANPTHGGTICLWQPFSCIPVCESEDITFKCLVIWKSDCWVCHCSFIESNVVDNDWSSLGVRHAVDKCIMHIATIVFSVTIGQCAWEDSWNERRWH